MFGTSRHLAVGPLSIPALLTSIALNKLDLDTEQQYIETMALLSFMIGVFYSLLGTIRFGFISNLISLPTLKGFMFGAAIITISSMTKNVLGFDMEKQTTLIKIVPNIYNNITDTHTFQHRSPQGYR